MSRVPGVVPRTTLLDTLTALHGASGATTARDVQAHLALSCKDRAMLYHQTSKTLHECLMIVEQALAQPLSSGSDSIILIYQQPSGGE